MRNDSGTMTGTESSSATTGDRRAPTPRWREISCVCGGHGIVSDYGGGDFNGAKECAECGGSGRQFLSDKGVIAIYPGGPLRGRLTKKELAQLTQSEDHQS